MESDQPRAEINSLDVAGRLFQLPHQCAERALTVILSEEWLSMPHSVSRKGLGNTYLKPIGICNQMINSKKDLVNTCVISLKSVARSFGSISQLKKDIKVFYRMYVLSLKFFRF